MADNSTFVILREAGELLHENCVTFERMEKVAAEREELQAVKKVRALHENVTRVSEMNKKLARDNALLNGALMAAHNDLLGGTK